MKMLSDKGCLWSWFFHYVPVGESPDVDLVPDAKQRQQILKAVYNARNTLPMMTVDFWGDGPEMMGCIAGGRQYIHVTLSIKNKWMNAQIDGEKKYFSENIDINIEKLSINVICPNKLI